MPMARQPSRNVIEASAPERFAVEAIADSVLSAGESEHHRGSDGQVGDAERRRVGFFADPQGACGRDQQVGSQHREGERDEAAGPCVAGDLFFRGSGSHVPENNERRKHLDQRVEPERDQGQGTGRKAEDRW